MTTFIVPYARGSAAADDRRFHNYAFVHHYLNTFGEPIHTMPLGLPGEHLDEPASRIARARNQGAEMAASDVLVFNDADSLVSGFQIIRAITAARQEPGLVLAYSRYRRLTRASTDRILADGWKAEHVESDWQSETSLSSGCVAISAACFDEIGGYDETWLDGFEDYDFALRCNERWGNRRVPGDLLHLWHERPAVEPEAGRDADRYRERWG